MAKGELRRLTDRPLHIVPELVGQPVAPPFGRAVALAMDYLILPIPATTVAVAAAALLLVPRTAERPKRKPARPAVKPKKSAP